MRNVSDYAVVYDISDDSERTIVDKILKGFGFRIQQSVFECRMKKRDKEILTERLQKLELKTGFVKIYRLEYSSKTSVIGIQKKREIDAGHAYII